ncbi:methyl-accepting chemotaxis protein [Rhodoferax koreense]|uniref:Methyl-accepting chemotaxis protein n=1 Tax=Rhodoferax koreensis TaxID=1842727 RepID=A0A1P8K230_9BURK|nr:methyl-accepting chemotaxis protein [Rhodoferax koreense]APW40055.1 methyl-accepting chemotaxis protein [Rhodoferax koreense]
MQFSDLKIGTRLGAGIVLAAALLAKMVWIGVANMAALQRELEMANGDRLPKIIAAKDIKDNLRARAILTRNIVLVDDIDANRKTVERLAEVRNQYARIDKQLQETVVHPDGKAALSKLEAAVAALREPTDRVVQLGVADKNAEATDVLLKVVAPLQATATDAADAFAEMQIKLGKAAEEQARAAYNTAFTFLILLGLAAVALLCGLGWLLVRSITRPLNQAVEVSRAVAAGDLSLQFEATGRNETSQLLLALKAMQASLAQVVGNVRQNAEGVATASAQISHGNNDLSARTEQQASALQQTAASMEELSSTVKQNADNARQANQLAQSASTVAVRGGDVVGQVVETMKGINDSSKKIADIISVIDGIAFQTNILALNAAVEAARAGEQGRGFAVVASEVRSLAQRSADAAKEIKNLISASVERVDQGTTLVDQAGVTMQEVVTAIRRVTDIMGEISAASTEQSQGVSQVGEAVTQMDQATQQNAALVEESAAAADSLSLQAQQLVQAVAVFKLIHGPAVAAPQLARPPAAAKPANPAVPAPNRVPVSKKALPKAAPARPTKAAAGTPLLQPASTKAKAAATATAPGGEGDWESF